MSNMTLNVEFLAGTELKECVMEAKEKALFFNVAYIQFNFNGVDFSIGRNADVSDVVDEFKNGSHKYWIIHS